MSDVLSFFNSSMGRHLVDQTSDALADADNALGSGHLMADKPIKQRIASGWAVVREHETTMQFRLAAKGLRYSTQTRYEAWLDALESFDGQPVILIEFSKKPVPAANLTRTYDLRAVSICSAVGVDTFDLTTEPGPMASMTQRVMWNLRTKQRGLLAA